MRIWQPWAVSSFLVAVLAAPAVADEPPEKEAAEQTWEGILKIGEASLRLVLHVKEGAGGALSATLDSPDQGASGLAVDSVTRDKTRLTFELKKLGAKFDGKFNAKGTEAVGTFSQGGADFPLTLKQSAAALAGAKAAANEQLWEGKLGVAAGIKIRLILRVVKEKSGALVATLDSPDENLKGLKVDPITIDKDKLAFELKVTAARYEGKLNAEGTEAEGHWMQRGAKLPLTFKRTEKVAEVRRPQTPQPPFPYKAESVSYANKAGGVTIAGTLTIPPGTGPFPAALMISGSGAQDRDEMILGHRPFAVIADALSRRGVAVLRVDDRGVGGSSGKTAESTTDDFAGDVLAGVAFLKARPEIDPKAIGLIGHSEGGIIAPIAAGRSQDVAFIVLLAGTGLPGEDILYLQGGLILQAMGATQAAIDKQKATQKRLFEILKNEKDPKTASAKLRESAKESLKDLSEAERKELGDVDALLSAQLKAVESPWFRYFLTYDPRPALAKVTCPVLALGGEKDLQVPPRENLSEIDKALKAAGNRRGTVKELPGLNHLFQTCRTGNVTEYAEIEETFAPSALTLLGDWVLEQVKSR